MEVQITALKYSGDERADLKMTGVFVVEALCATRKEWEDVFKLHLGGAELIQGEEEKQEGKK